MSIDLRQVLLGINGHTMDAHLIMNVASRAAARGPDITDDLSARDFVPDLHVNAGAMAITGTVAVSMFYGDQPAITRFPSRVSHDAVRRGADGGINLIGDIHSHVTSWFTGQGRGPFAESGSNPPLDGPNGRGGRQDGALLAEKDA